MRLFTLRRPLIDSVRDALGLICQGCARSVPSWLPTPSPGFSQVFILKVVKVLCFDTLLQMFILKGLGRKHNRQKVVYFAIAYGRSLQLYRTVLPLLTPISFRHMSRTMNFLERRHTLALARSSASSRLIGF